MGHTRKIIKKLIENLGIYVALLPVLTYYLGFIYVQGMMVPFNKNFSLWDVRFEVLPFTIDLYLINGIIYMIKIVGSIFIAAVMWDTIVNVRKHKGFNKYVSKARMKIEIQIKNKKVIKIKNISKRLFVYILSPYFIISPLICTIFLNFGFIFMYMEKRTIEFESKFFDTSILTVIFLNAFVLYDYIQNKISYYSTRNAPTISKNVPFFFFAIIMGISLTVNAYIHGFSMQVEKLSLVFNQGRGHVKMASVYTDKDTYKNYYKIQITKDSFIGWDTETENIDLIPMGGIKKIVTWNGTEEFKVKKYIQSNSVNILEREIINVIDKYYMYRTNKETQNAQQFINLLSESIS
ncbi:hypothetical protein [Aneurinibacillus aneurinilyticus]|uniref:Uncharacterized protein n=1 Tax=Aneurinibacillus aneurinilyticus TaxID=1391 RepID=A0A848D614_ANEAE|nr:hypothetical protein [Aneurinibacillus aneurinilyticus]NMF01578.1 hypothetical protein [Aneurinibacillus aneurinilyticus]